MPAKVYELGHLRAKKRALAYLTDALKGDAKQAKEYLGKIEDRIGMLFDGTARMDYTPTAEIPGSDKYIIVVVDTPLDGVLLSDAQSQVRDWANVFLPPVVRNILAIKVNY